jgi:thiosulfate/3-mercaptopyruvate sulfurtransferase
MTGPLVSTDWLAAHLDDPGLVVLDASWHMPAENRDARSEYAEQHIPGGLFFDIDAIADHSSGLPHMLPSAQVFATAVRRLGVSQTSTVVAYDAVGVFSAPRAWWSFRANGHEAAFVLDGGLPKWLAEGRPVESGWREPPHGDFKAKLRPGLVRGFEAVRDALASGAEQLVDARAAARFRGEAPEPRAGLRSGHMPGARNLPWSEVVLSGSLAPPEALQAAFAGAGVDLDKPMAATCGSGLSACILALAAAALGRDAVAVYDGSWTEWATRGGAPIATGPA